MFNRRGRGRDRSPPMEISLPTNVQKADQSDLLQSLYTASGEIDPRFDPAPFPRRNTSLPPHRSQLTGKIDTVLIRSATESHFPTVSAEAENQSPHDEPVRSPRSVEGDPSKTLRGKRSFFKDASERIASMVPSSRHRSQASSSSYREHSDDGYEHPQLATEYVFDFDTAQEQIESNRGFRVIDAGAHHVESTTAVQPGPHPQEIKSLLTSPKIRRFFGHETQRDEHEQRLRQLSISKDDQAKAKSGYRVQGDEVLHEDPGEAIATTSRQPSHSGQVNQMKSVYEGSEEELVGMPFTVSGLGLTGQSPTKFQAAEPRLRRTEAKERLSDYLYDLEFDPNGMTVYELLQQDRQTNHDFESFKNQAETQSESSKSVRSSDSGETLKPAKKTGLLPGLTPYSEPLVSPKDVSPSADSSEFNPTWKGKGNARESGPPPTPPPKDADHSDDYEPIEIGTARKMTVTRIPPGTARIVDIPPRKKKPSDDTTKSNTGSGQPPSQGASTTAPFSSKTTRNVQILEPDHHHSESLAEYPNPPSHHGSTSSSSSVETHPNPLRSNPNPLRANPVGNRPNPLRANPVEYHPNPLRANAVSGSGSGPTPPNRRAELRGSDTVDSPWEAGPLNMHPAMHFAEPPDWIRNTQWWKDHKDKMGTWSQEDLFRSWLRAWGDGDIPTGPQNRPCYAEDFYTVEEAREFINFRGAQHLADSPLKRVLCGSSPAGGETGEEEEEEPDTPRQNRR